jgi:tyrosinase
VRRDAVLLADDGDGTRILDAYASAVQTMRDLEPGDEPPQNPLSWRFQAAIHGYKMVGPDFRRCEHNSWFFLPWHRIYLYRFERIVQHHLGDPTWALPYWGYSKGTEEGRKLPRQFVEGGAANPLVASRRSATMKAGGAMGEGHASAVDALGAHPFAADVADATSTFGGGMIKTVARGDMTRGSLEGIPHGSVHMAVGGDMTGWMSTFETAALDPIFWLHHANVDRLWETWRVALGNPGMDDPDWLRTAYEFYDVDGEKHSMKIEEVLDTTALGYTYDTIDPPPGVTPPAPAPHRVGIRAEGPPSEEARPAPELVGATTDVSLAEPVTVSVGLEPPRRALGMTRAPDEPERWHLRVENVTGEAPGAVAYAVDLHAGGADEAPIRVGSIAAFGIAEASQADERHDGSGLTDVFEITDAVRELDGRGVWDASTANVTVTPLGVQEEPVPGGDVRIGRVSFYRG